MRRLVVFNLIAILALCAHPAVSQKNEYFTEEEVDLIRDAQEIKARVGVLFQLADHRLTFLGIKEKTEKEKKEPGFFGKLLEKGVQKVIKQPAGGPKPVEPIDPEVYLVDFTKSELLRGYIEALDEVMANIDDAYERKFDVRDTLESLEKYTSEAAPLLAKYEAKTPAEQAALRDARDKTEEALDGAREAMQTVPKTEKKAR